MMFENLLSLRLFGVLILNQTAFFVISLLFKLALLSSVQEHLFGERNVDLKI